jgi:hypothetical protein
MKRASRSWLSLLLVMASGAPAMAQQSRAGTDGKEDAREAEMFGEEPATEALESEAPDSEAPDLEAPDSEGDASKRDASEREAEMFGEGSVAPEATVEAGRKPGEPLSRDEAVLGESVSPEDILERLESADDTLEIGGLAFLRYSYFALDEGKAQEFAVSSPSFVDLYLDARPSEQIRFFSRARLRHDATLEEDKSNVALDQLWLKFNIDLTAFFTIGRQRIKWGTGRFWNPTDFLNTDALDALSVVVFDERLGVSLAKLHIPVESIGANLYAIASLDDGNTAEKIGGALRLEFLLGQTEVSATVAARRSNPLRMGLDASGAFGPFDLRAEAAVQYRVKSPFFRGSFDASPLRIDEFNLQGVAPEDIPDAVSDQLPDVLAGRQPERFFRDDEFIPQVMLGAEYGRNYTDDDAIYVGAEYFFNDLGYANADLYPVLFAEGQFTPFYTGRHYAGAYVFLPAPGSWNNTNFTTSTLANLSDRSAISRLDYSRQVLTYLTLNTFVMGHWGKSGEFNYSYEQAALLEPALVQQIPAEELSNVPSELLQDIKIVSPLLSIGFGLRATF